MAQLAENTQHECEDTNCMRTDTKYYVVNRTRKVFFHYHEWVCPDHVEPHFTVANPEKCAKPDCTRMDTAHYEIGRIHEHSSGMCAWVCDEHVPPSKIPAKPRNISWITHPSPRSDSVTEEARVSR